MFCRLYVISPRSERFWLAHLLNAVGRFAIVRKFGFNVQPIAEGSVFFSAFITVLFIFGHSMVGEGGYMVANIPSHITYFLLLTLVTSAVAEHGRRVPKLTELYALSNSGNLSKFEARVEKTVNIICGKAGALVFAAGAALNLLLIHLANIQDHIYDIISFYVTDQSPAASQVFILEPPSYLGLAGQLVQLSFMSGLLAIGALMTFATLSLLTHLNADYTIKAMNLDPYSPWPLGRVTDMLTSFWLMTSSGLLIIPLQILISGAFRIAGRLTFSKISILGVYYYPAFLISFFIMSSLLVKRFISQLKSKRIRELYEKLKNPQADSKGGCFSLELELVDRVPEGPVGGIFMQLFQISVAVGLALLNFMH